MSRVKVLIVALIVFVLAVTPAAFWHWLAEVTTGGNPGPLAS